MPEAALVPDAIVRALVRALHDAAPREFVGVLGGRTAGTRSVVAAFVALPNRAPGDDAFAVAAADFAAAEARLRAAGHDFVGFAHGHPRAPATPSHGDAAAFWPHCLQAIVGPCGHGAAVRCFWRDGATVREVPVRAAAGEAAA